ncbi:fatty acid elongase [Blumeria hordei DH14]|uniref:Elongation of fatty acids protein n=1 Tax=Blumeria graminis f. sp. hordei (strain DH14) TaxID=546991 RepID=N1JKK7_BLUG1|nr:fatty acid elongase [Blumeria hordei DH14]
MVNTIYFSRPSTDLLQFPPSDFPSTLPPPLSGSAPFTPPIDIPTDIYNAALDIKIPITIAIIYAFSALILNAYNHKCGNRPWKISKTRTFSSFVFLHNILLAVYSGWTFLGMWGTMQRSVPIPSDQSNLVHTVDALCKIHGSRGLGESINFNQSTSLWSPTSSHGNTPDLGAMGRIWNEGLSFYGWIFYLSKFYEVLDTFIIIVKGKQSGTLQTYHHAGAMFSMWAGIRYMSPPIWMFVFVNSAIHTIMYTYFTITGIGIKVPRVLKQGITTLQITQFVVGSLYAAIHLFISYEIPVQVSITESFIEDIPKVIVDQPAQASTFLMSISRGVKNMLVASLGRLSVPPQSSEVLPKITEEVKFRTEYQNVPCLDTTGQAFAICLNIIYLTPLTILFVQFFIHSYLRQPTNKSPAVGDLNSSSTNKKITSGEKSD